MTDKPKKPTKPQSIPNPPSNRIVKNEEKGTIKKPEN